MPRAARVVLPKCPHHIIQRGHNRQTVFAGDGDYLLYLSTLMEWKNKLGCSIYAYCLMTNHVHLVIDPGEDVRSLGLLMKRVAGRQTRWVNKRAGRSGSLWEGRYRSSPVDSERYLFACCRYVELNPVRAGIARGPEGYPWSSYGPRAGLARNSLLDAFPGTQMKPPSKASEADFEGADPVLAYRRWIQSPIPHGEWDLVREAVRRGQLTGDERFREAVFKQTGRRLEARGPGNPRRRNQVSKPVSPWLIDLSPFPK